MCIRDSGYTIIEAANGREALESYRQHGIAIALMVTDVAMPEMGGRELAARLRELAPELPVLFISGYTGEEVIERGLLPSGVPFVSKPFSPESLADRLRGLLDRARGSRG